MNKFEEQVINERIKELESREKYWETQIDEALKADIDYLYTPQYRSMEKFLTQNKQRKWELIELLEALNNLEGVN